MAELKNFNEPEVHKFFGIECNIKVWDFLSKANRTEDENEKMIHSAHASHYHWSHVGTAVHATRGEWLISHVYSVLGRPEPAMHHALRCLKICLDGKIGDFDLAYAYESMARAFATNGNLDDARKYHTLAKEAGSLIKDSEEKGIFQGDFETEPWYGLKK